MPGRGDLEELAHADDTRFPRHPEEAIDAVSLEELNAYLAQRAFGRFTVVTIGSAELNAAASTRGNAVASAEAADTVGT